MSLHPGTRDTEISASGACEQGPALLTGHTLNLVQILNALCIDLCRIIAGMCSSASPTCSSSCCLYRAPIISRRSC